MQSHFLKIFVTFVMVILQFTDSQAQLILSDRADSLFNSKNYLEAAKELELLVDKHDLNKENSYLRLAYCYEQMGDFSKAILYLSKLYELSPTDQLFERISKIATENDYIGFERSEINFLVTFYKQYYWHILIIGLLLCAYFIYYMLSKQGSGKPLNTVNTTLIIAFVVSLLILNNFTKVYKQGILSKNEVLLRKGPSNASEIVGKLSEGHKLNVVGREDIWYKVFWKRQIVFVKENDLWIVN